MTSFSALDTRPGIILKATILLNFTSRVRTKDDTVFILKGDSPSQKMGLSNPNSVFMPFRIIPTYNLQLCKD